MFTTLKFHKNFPIHLELTDEGEGIVDLVATHNDYPNSKKTLLMFDVSGSVIRLKYASIPDLKFDDAGRLIIMQG